MIQPKVQIKGIREGLLVIPGEGSWEEVHQAILAQIDEQAEFLKGGRLAIDLGNHVLKAAEMGKLRDEISGRGLVLWAVLSNSPTTERTAQALGMATRLNKPRPERNTHPLETTLHSGEGAIVVRRTLRSGYSLQHSGHVVVIGDVNPGAEIIASGDVIVWGHLRGMVHAGAEGNDNAVVCALDLAPTQLRIGGLIATSPGHRGKPQPELARVKDGQVVAETWNPKRK
jgi:septum site-determining protein MinC